MWSSLRTVNEREKPIAIRPCVSCTVVSFEWSTENNVNEIVWVHRTLSIDAWAHFNSGSLVILRLVLCGCVLPAKRSYDRIDRPPG